MKTQHLKAGELLMTDHPQGQVGGILHQNHPLGFCHVPMHPGHVPVTHCLHPNLHGQVVVSPGIPKTSAAEKQVVSSIVRISYLVKGPR